MIAQVKNGDVNMAAQNEGNEESKSDESSE